MDEQPDATMAPDAADDPLPRPNPVVSQPGRQRYHVVGEVGQGGMGEVVCAHDGELDRDVAMKMLRAQRARDSEAVSRFFDEARATARLEHPNIVPIHEVGYNPAGVPYFTMRLVRGKTIRELIDELRQGDARAHERLHFVRRLQIVQAVCDALSYAHAQSILHRDIKPANVMVGEFGEVVVMDWGLAKQLGPEAVTSPISRSGRRVTGRGTVLGTPAYMPPEQAGGDTSAMDERSDVYALGALMYELFTLQPPHAGTSTIEVLASVIARDPVAPEELVVAGQPRVPREISLIIQRAMAREKEQRFASARDLHEKIQAYLEGRADVVCVHTAVKRALGRLATFVDEHHRLAITLLALIVCGPTFLLIALVIALLR